MEECSDDVVKVVIGKLRKDNNCNPEQDACYTEKYFATMQEFDITDGRDMKHSFITISYQDHDVQHFTTHINYGSSELICEIGGVLGLTLGASALSTMGYIQIIFKTIFVKIRVNIQG